MVNGGAEEDRLFVKQQVKEDCRRALAIVMINDSCLMQHP